MATTLLPRTARPSYKSGFARSASESANPGLWRGLVGAWLPLMGPTGLTLRDISGRGNNGALTNMEPATDWIITSDGYMLEMGGTNEYVEASDTELLIAGKSEMTLVSEMGRTSTGNIMETGFFGSGAHRVQILWYNDGNVYFAFANGVSNFEFISHNVTGTYSFALVFGETSYQGFIDGVQVANDSSDSASTVSSSLSSLRIGGGQLASVGTHGTTLLYDRALLAGELRQLYRDPLAPFRRKPLVISIPAAAPGGGRIMSSIVGAGGLAGSGGIAGSGGGLAG